MSPTPEATLKRVRAMIFAKVYPLYLAKAQRKNRSQAEVNQIIHWLTGYDAKALATQLKNQANLESFFANAPKMNPARTQITGSICGIKLAEIQDPFMREVRYLDKLIDELAKGKPLQKILRNPIPE